MAASFDSLVKKYADSNPVSFTTLSNLCTHNDELIVFLLKSGLLGDRSGICETCKEGTVHLIRKEGSFYWKCGKRSCVKTISLRKGSFFEKSRLDYRQILCLIYCWLYELPFTFVQAEELVTTNKSVVDWYNFCRDICIDILLKDNTKIGGPGHIVEIDESKFGKRKYNKGRCVDGSWVLGGIDRQTRDTFFQVVPNRTKETLLPILIENIHPESIVISDCWKSYNSVSEHFKQHLSVNHSLHFVDPDDSKVHTNSIESQWRVLKRNVLPKNGTNKSLYSSYFSMWCVKKKYLKDVPCPFKAFLELIKRVHPLEPSNNTPRKDLRSKQNNETPSKVSTRSEPQKRPHPFPELSSDSDFE